MGCCVCMLFGMWFGLLNYFGLVGVLVVMIVLFFVLSLYFLIYDMFSMIVN